MKSIFYAIMISLFAGGSARAQELSLGLRGGLSIPNLTAGGGNANPLNGGYSSRLGPDFGVFAQIRFSGLFSLRPMLEYSSQGGKKNGLQALTTPDQMTALFPPGQAPQYVYADYKSEAKLNYLLLPLLARFGFKLKGTPFSIYADAGPFAGLLLSAHQVTSGESPLYADAGGRQPLGGGAQSFDANTNVRNSLHRVNGGIEGNVGIACELGAGSIFMEGGGNYGFFNIQKNPRDGVNETGAALVTLGYIFRLGR